MSPKLNFIFFLWRREGTTPEQFADYYESRHLPLVSTLVPPPPIHERSYPLDSRTIALGIPPREGIFSFDSVTAVTFDSQSDFEARLRSLADDTKSKQAKTDEARFTETDKRLTYVAEAEISEGPEYGDLTAEARAGAGHVFQISRRRPGIERTRLKSDYEAELSASGPLPGELRHARYYLLPEHPFSDLSGAWGSESKSAIDVVQDITFRTQKDAEQAIERLRAAARKSSVIDEETTVVFVARQVSGIPDFPYEVSHDAETPTTKGEPQEEPRSAKPWSVIARFDVKEGCEAEWIQLVQEVIEAMKHEKTFISTSMCAHRTEPGKFMLYEVWEDRDEFYTTQVKREYRHSLMERLPALLRSPVVFEEWTEIRADYTSAIRAHQ